MEKGDCFGEIDRYFQTILSQHLIKENVNKLLQYVMNENVHSILEVSKEYFGSVSWKVAIC